MQPRIIDGKYEILRELSQGGMGAVYEARHLLTRRRVAVKLILAETLARKRASDALRRFEREARAAGSIESRHVVSVLDTGVDATTRDNYIVMELLSGEDLRQHIRRVGKLAPELVLAIAFQVCQGLRRAHELGIIHRDIKSGNIFLARQDDGHVEVKILDFGIAKLRVDPLAARDGHDLTRSGSVLGSPLYMSPEQATGSRELDARADIWSLGVVMYEALTGATPHGSQALGAVILAICSEPARPIRERAPDVPVAIAALVHKALALEPRQRFASAEEMQAAIEQLLPGGAALHESVFGPIPGRTGVETTSEAPQSGSEPSATPPAETTVGAVTYGSGPTKPGASRTRRLARKPAAVVAGLLLLAGGIGLFRHSANVPPPGAAERASSGSVAVSEEPSPSPPQPRPEPVVPAAPSQASATQAAPGAPSAAVPRVLARKPAQRSAPPPIAGPPPSNAPPIPSPASPPAGNEPAIERRFD